MSRSEDYKKMWQNPAYRKRMLQTIKVNSRDPEIRKRISESMKLFNLIKRAKYEQEL